MKRKNVCAKLLLLFLCFTLAFAGLVGCKTDELEEKMNAMQNELNGVKEDKAEAEALAELKALVEEVKATADAAATVAKFEEAIAKLESADAANSDALNTAKEELKALIDANADTADAATKAALKEALDKITALEAAAATKEALKTEVDALVAAIDKKADKTALEAAIADLQGKIDANGTADAETKAALQKAITDAIAASEKGDANKLAAAVATLNKTIDDNKAAAAADLKNAADKAKQDLDAAVAKLESADTTNKAALEAAIDELEAAIVANGSADADTEAALKALITANAENDAAALAGAVTELQNNIAAKDLENDKALSEAVEALEGKIAAVDFTDAEELKAAIDAAVAEVNAKIDTKADKTALQNAVDALEDKIAAVDFTDAEELKDAIDAAVAQVNADIAKKADLEYVNAEIGKLNVTIKANADAIAALQADVDAAEAALTAAEAAIDALEADVEALEADVAELKTAATKNAADIKAANDAIAALEARVKALEDDTTAADALKAAVEELKQADADADKAIADLDVAYKAADADLEAKIDEAKTALEGKIDEAKTDLEGKIAAVNTKLADLATKTEFTALQGIVDNLEKDVAALQEQIADLVAGKDSFKNDYEAATSVLAGESWLVVERNEEGAVLKVAIEAAENALAEEYSRYVFTAIMKSVDKNHFTQADYDAFLAEYETLDFFLNRAVSPEAIVGYFDALNAYIKGMPSLIETLTKKLAERTTVTAEETCLDDIHEIVDLIEKNNWNEPIPGTDPVEYYEGRYLEIEYKDLYDAYVLVSAAHDNLLAAVAAGAEKDADGKVNALYAIIDEIGYVVYNPQKVAADSEETVDASKVAIDAARVAVTEYITKYFGDKTLNAFYFESAEDATAEAYAEVRDAYATAYISNYAVLTTAEARYAQLVDAAAHAIEVIEIALNYNVTRPLWSDLQALTDNLALYNAAENSWLVNYDIDEIADAITIEAIYGDKIELLKAAQAYAEKMNDIYTTKEFAGLGEEKLVGVDALNAATALLANIAVADVKWTDKAQFDAYVDAYGDLLAAIILVPEYDTDKDDNYEEMIASVADGIKAVTARLTKLDEANNALDKLYDDNAALLKNVTFKDFDTIDNLKKAIDKVYADAEVAVDDDNYKAFAAEKDVNKLYVELLAEYMDLTAKVREIYDTVTQLMAGAPMRLAFGNDLDGFMDEVLRIMDLGVPSNNLTLPGKDGAETANLDTLLANLTTLAAQYEALAEEAEAEAAKVAEAIKNIKSATTLNNYSEIKRVYADVLQAWITKYLAGDVAFADGDVVAAINAVKTVKRYNKSADEAENYTFLVIADYNKGVETMAAADELLKNANAEWATLKVTLETLTAKTWSIHDIQAYIDADAAFLAYVKEYYNTAATADDPLAVITKEGEQNGEKAVYSAFKTVYDKCQNAVNDSAADKKDIEDAIAALPVDITVANYKDVLAQVKVIDQLVAEYTEAYCADLCEDCVAADLLLTVRVKDTIAQLIAYGEDQKALVDDATDVKIENEVDFYKNIIKRASSANTAKTTLDVAKGAINDVVEAYNAANP